MSNQHPPPDYEKRVTTAVKPLLNFHAHLMDDLDDNDGAFGFWRGGSDWKTYALLADYLIQSVLGTTTALHAAGLAAIEHRQVTYSANFAAKKAFKDMKEGKLTQDEYLAAVLGSSEARKKSLRAESSAEHTFFHMGQALDRFSAALVIVGGFGVKDVANSDWKTVESLLIVINEKRERNTVEPLNTKGRNIQERLLAPAVAPDAYGSDSWLAWLRDTRNAMTHRPPSKHLNLLQKDGSIIQPFYLLPKWSELQTLVYGPMHEVRKKGGSSRNAWMASFLIKRSEDVLDGLLDSLCNFIAELTETMTVCWSERKAAPTAIIQSGTQWRKVEPNSPDRPFGGYGDDPPMLNADSMVMHPNDAKRLRAGRVTDDRVQDWRD